MRKKSHRPPFCVPAMIGRKDFYMTENEKKLFAEVHNTTIYSLNVYSNELTPEFDMICNDEIIEINQDALASYPKLQKTYGQRDTVIYRRELWGGDFAVAVFNMGEVEFCDTFELDGTYHVRDVWAKEDVGTADRLPIDLMPHSVIVYRMSKK